MSRLVQVLPCGPERKSTSKPGRKRPVDPKRFELSTSSWAGRAPVISGNSLGYQRLVRRPMLASVYHARDEIVRGLQMHLAGSMESFPHSSLTPRQTVIVGELLRDHPEGRVVSHNGRPVFVTQDKPFPLIVSLSVVDQHERQGSEKRPGPSAPSSPRP